jgi:hypothetical protein
MGRLVAAGILAAAASGVTISSYTGATTSAAFASDNTDDGQLSESVRFRGEVHFPNDDATMQQLLTDPDAVQNEEQFGYLATDAEVEELARRDHLAELAAAFDVWGKSHETFGGTFQDHARDGLVVVSTTDPSDVDELTQVGREAGLESDQFDIRTVPNSYATLEEAVHQAMELPDVVGAGIDTEGNGILVVSSVSDPRVPDEIDGVPTRTVTGTNADNACASRFSCTTNIRAGIALDQSGSTRECTSGFAAEDSDGFEVVLTAGHCFYGVSAYIENDGTTIGHTEGHNALVAGSTSDSRPIRIYNPPDIRAWIYLSSTDKDHQITGVRGSIVQYNTVCIRAIHSQNCGTVETVGYNYVDEVCSCPILSAYLATYANIGGDSGGPIVGTQGDIAWGINAGTTDGWGRFTAASRAEVETGVNIRHF